jgi:hypothetical protein
MTSGSGHEDDST